MRKLILITVLLTSGCGEIYLTRTQELILRANIPEHCIKTALDESSVIEKVIIPSRKTGREESKSFIAVGDDVEAAIYLTEDETKKIEIGYGYMEMQPLNRTKQEQHNRFLLQLQHIIMESCGITEKNVTILEQP